MRFNLAAAAIASAFFVATNAQAQYPVFDASEIDENLKAQWCVAQQGACPLLCYDRGTLEDINDCEWETLQATCLCDDGKAPSLNEYSQTVPYFKCTWEVEQCVNNCNGIAICASRCREERPCGAKDPKRLNTTSTTAAPTASKTGSADDSEFTGGFGSDGGKSGGKDTKDSSASAKQFGLGVLILGLGAGFTLFL